MVVPWEGQMDEHPMGRQRDDRLKWKMDGRQFYSEVGVGGRLPYDWGEQMDNMLMVGPGLPV